jgi:hypothetical protein
MATTYIYPEDLGVSPDKSNHMIFTTRKIVGTKAGAVKGTGTGTQPMFGGNFGEIILPIPSGLNVAYSQGWDQQSVGFSNQLASANAGGTIDAIARQMQEKDMGGTMKAIGAGITGMKDAFMEIGGSGAGFESTSGAGFMPEATGFLMTSPGLQSIAQASQFTMGQRALDQTMISYSGPGFRSFNFNFSFKPMSLGESATVTQIINHFKIYMAPEQKQADFTRIYELPNVFKIQFYYGSTEHAHISKIGHCALTNIGVTYGGEKFSTFEGSHAPVQVDITLQFKEMELLNRELLEDESQANFLGVAGGTLQLESVGDEPEYSRRGRNVGQTIG